MIYNYICENTNPMAKYNNGYIVKHDYVELHIFDNTTDIVAIIDLKDYARVRQCFWSFSYTGKSGNKQIAIYTTSFGRPGIRLNRYITNIDDAEHNVRFINKNPLDFRRDNLVIAHKNVTKVHANTKKTICGIQEIHDECQDRQTGYVVYYKKNGVRQSKYFGTNKYETLDKAFENAVSFRNGIKA